MADAKELLIKLTVDAAQAQARLKAIENSTKSMDGNFKKMSASVDSFGASFGKLKAAAGTLAAIAGAFKSMKFAVDAKDQIDQLEGSFKALLGSGDRAADMLSRVFQVVQNTGADMKNVGEAVQRLSIAMVDMGASNAQISQVAESFIKLGRVGGSSMADISGAMLQFTQALSSGRLQGDELRSIMERVPGVIKVIAKEMGVTAGEVRKLGSEGKITADIMANAMLKASKDINEQFKELPETSDQAFNRMKAEALKFGKTFNDAFNISGAWTAVLKASAEGFKSLSEMTSDFGVFARSVWADVLSGYAKYVETRTKFTNSVALKKDGELAKKNWQEMKDAQGRAAEAQKVLSDYIDKSASGVAKVNEAYGQLDKKLASTAGKSDTKLSEFQKLVMSLNEELAKLSAGDGPLTKVNELTAKLSAGTLTLNAAERERVLGIAALIDAQKAKNEAAKEAIELQKRLAAEAVSEVEAEAQKAKTLYEQAQALERTLDPLKNYTYEMEKLMELKPYMSAEAFSAAMDQVREKLEKAGEKSAETNDRFKELKDAIEGYGKQMADGFVEAIASGENFGDSFKKMAASILKDLAKMIVQKQIFDKLFASMGSGGSGFLGGLGRLLGFAKGGAFGTATGLPYGVYTTPTLFPMPGSGPLQKFARGGVLGEAGPEAIMPLRRGQDGRLGVESSPVNVVVNNYSGQNVEVKQERDNIEITIGRIVSDIVQGGSRVSRAIESTYNLGRQGGL